MKIKNIIFTILTIFLISNLSSLIYTNSDQFNDLKKNFGNVNPINAEDPQQIIEINRTTESKQLINDPHFSSEPVSSPWNVSKSGDLSDLNANIDSQQSNITIIGNSSTFSEVDSNFSPSEWAFSQNPEFPTYPDTYVMNTTGFAVSHTFAETAKQSPCAQIEKNITMPVDMSDYIITSANLEVVCNASVRANDSLINSLGPSNYGIDCPLDPTNHSATYDYAYFYLMVADLAHDKKYELAYNKTYDLGKDSAGYTDVMLDTYLSNIPESEIIQYLTSVLNSDNFNFTIILGIRIWSEDNWAHDRDYWDSLVIKNCSLSFTYEKKVDQGNNVKLNQMTSKIDSSDYPALYDIQVNSAKLNFDYNISNSWPTTSPNSEIRVFMDDVQYTEAIKLSNVTSTSQQVKNGEGFDVTTLFALDKNISLTIQIYIGDSFGLESNISLFIDNIYLTVNYTIIAKGDAIQTNLQNLGSDSITVSWSDTITIQLNYTETNSTNPINNATLHVAWQDNYNVTKVGNGIYNISCFTTNLTINQRYRLDISTSNNNPLLLSSDTFVEINIIERSADIDLFLNGENMTESPVINLAVKDKLNISTYYFEKLNGEIKGKFLTEANISILGGQINSSYYELNQTGDFYQISMDTEKLGIGVHDMSLYIKEANYEEGFAKIRVNIKARDTYTNIFINSINSTLNPRYTSPILEEVNISAFYHDSIDNELIFPNSVELSGLDNETYAIDTTGDSTKISIDTSKLRLGIYYITLSSNVTNYYLISDLIVLDLIPRDAVISVFVNGTNSSLSSGFNVPITGFLNISVSFNDMLSSNTISSVDSSLTGISQSSINKTSNQNLPDLQTDFLISTADLGIGTFYLSITGQKENYNSISEKYRLNINKISTNITTPSGNSTFSIITQNDFNLNLLILNQDFGGRVTDCEVKYSWKFGSGQLNELNDGTFSVDLKNVPEGVYNINITVYKEDPNYDFQTRIITLNVLPTQKGGLSPLLISLLIGLTTAVSISFYAYQKYFKYPKVIRELHKVKRSIKHGKTTNLVFQTKSDLFVNKFKEIMKKDL